MNAGCLRLLRWRGGLLLDLPENFFIVLVPAQHEHKAAALAAEVEVVVIPGPTAATTDLVSSGLPSDRFMFLGFLPRSSPARQRELQAAAQFKGSIILYESPHRLVACLADIHAVLGDRPVAIGRELTKLHEEVWRGPVTGALAEFGQRERIRGEIAVVIGGDDGSGGRWSEDQVKTALQERMTAGAARKVAAAEIAKLSGWRKREIYALSLD